MMSQALLEDIVQDSQLTVNACVQVRAMNYVIDSGMVRDLMLTARCATLIAHT